MQTEELIDRYCTLTGRPVQSITAEEFLLFYDRAGEGTTGAVRTPAGPHQRPPERAEKKSRKVMHENTEPPREAEKERTEDSFSDDITEDTEEDSAQEVEDDTQLSVVEIMKRMAG